MALVSARQLRPPLPILKDHGFAAEVASREEVIPDDASASIRCALGQPNPFAG